MAKTLKLKLKAQGDVLTEAIHLADNPLTRMLGLMGKPGLEQGQGLLIKPCNSVHSCFMRFRFDAVFLDSEGKVLRVIEGMKPWRCSPFVKGAKQVLELAEGESGRLGLVPDAEVVFESLEMDEK